MGLGLPAHHFKTEGKATDIRAFGSGHIHDTYLVLCDSGKRYVLQQINNKVFKKPAEVMENIDLVSRHLAVAIARSQEPDLKAVQVIPTNQNKPLYIGADGSYWRMYNYIDGTTTYDQVDSADIASAAASAYGKFARLLSDIDASRLHITIDKFHDYNFRLANLKNAIQDDKADRLKYCKEEIEAALKWIDFGSTIQDKIDNGLFPIRVTHNDTKINNVLINKQLLTGVSVIDLDTIMPGCLLHDFGDMVRTFVSPVEEDDENLEKVLLRKDIFIALSEGYLNETKVFLTKNEQDHLVESGMFMTLIMACRFLTDFLEGDVYYKTSKPNHSLHRARNQFTLIESISAQKVELERIIKGLV